MWEKLYWVTCGLFFSSLPVFISVLLPAFFKTTLLFKGILGYLYSYQLFMEDRLTQSFHTP